MNLDKRTKVCLKKLIQINREIYKRYLKIECRQNIEINTQEIFLLIEKEKEVIAYLNLNIEKMERIKKHFQGIMSVNLDDDLIKLSLFVDSRNYPYLRTYARIYYSFCYSKMINNLDNKSVFIDQEVLNLYRLLINLAKSEDSIDISFFSKVILLNSPLAEEEILKNNFNPVIAYDLVEFTSELYTAMEFAIKRREGCENIIIDLERIKRSILSRKEEFDKIFHELLKLILNNLPLYANGDIFIKMACCYFEVIFSLLDQPSREIIYKSIDDSKTLNNLQYNTYGFLEDFVPSLEEKISRDLDPYSHRISLFKF